MTSGQENNQNLKNKGILLLIIGIPVLIIAFSSLLYYMADSRVIDLGTVNRGQLISPPIQIAELGLENSQSERLDYSKPEPKWTFLVFGDSVCEGDCERMLYLTRQTHVASAKKFNDLRRYFVSVDGPPSASLQEYIDKEHQGLTTAFTGRETLTQLLSPTGIDPLQGNNFFLVDPQGWIMMTYAAEDMEQVTLSKLSKDVLKDIKRLLQ